MSYQLIIHYVIKLPIHSHSFLFERSVFYLVFNVLTFIQKIQRMRIINSLATYLYIMNGFTQIFFRIGIGNIAIIRK